MNFKIYLSGAMSGLTQEEQTAWRNNMENKIKMSSAYYGCSKTPVFFNPPDWYNFEECEQLNEKEQQLYQKEAMFYDIHNLRNSDLMVVCLDHVNTSIGTAMEIAIAKELKIPVIGFFNDYSELTNEQLEEKLKKVHPWIVNSLDKFCRSAEDAYMYVIEFFLN